MPSYEKPLVIEIEGYKELQARLDKASDRIAILGDKVVSNTAAIGRRAMKQIYPVKFGMEATYLKRGKPSNTRFDEKMGGYKSGNVKVMGFSFENSAVTTRKKSKKARSFSEVYMYDRIANLFEHNTRIYKKDSPSWTGNNGGGIQKAGTMRMAKPFWLDKGKSAVVKAMNEAVSRAERDIGKLETRSGK